MVRALLLLLHPALSVCKRKANLSEISGLKVAANAWHREGVHAHACGCKHVCTKKHAWSCAHPWLVHVLLRVVPHGYMHRHAYMHTHVHRCKCMSNAHMCIGISVCAQLSVHVHKSPCVCTAVHVFLPLWM